MSSPPPDTREKILAAAWALLEEGGGKGVRMADVAKRAGLSRQAVYLHFPSRADLLIAATRYIDDVKDVDGRLAESRAAPTGRARMEAFIEAWASYVPEVHGVCRALLAMRDTDVEAAAAWDDRMAALRDGCAAVVQDLASDGDLPADLDPEAATDLLWTLLSVRNWEHLTEDCGWSQERYVEAMRRSARRLLTDA